MKNLEILSLFSGIGAFEKALDNIGIKYNLVGFSEIDKYAIQSYCSIHNTPESFNLGDITKIEINKLPRFIDMITHGSPCQDFSIAGKQAGAEKDSGTRSSLMWNTVDIVEWCLPKYVIWENVKNLLSKKHKHNFDSYIETMDKLGYNSYYQVLNAKDYEVPQNRERVYTVSIRKDIDNNNFKFPEKEELKIRLKDILEEAVEEKYYLSEKMFNYILDFNNTQKGTKWEGRADNDILNGNIAHAIGVRSAGGNQRAGVSNFVVDGYDDEIKVKDLKMQLINKITESNIDPKCIQVGKLDIKGHDCVKRVYSKEGISPTLTNMQGGNRQPKIIVKNATKQGYVEAFEGDSINLAYPNSKTRRGRVGKQVSQTLQCNENMGVVTPEMRIRKLTPKECWRLMRLF